MSNQPPALHAKTCTDCDYCGRIRICESDGYGGKACRSCLQLLTKRQDEPTSVLVAVEVTRGENADGERKWLVTPIYRRYGKYMTIPDDRGWDTAREAFAEAEGLRRDAQARGTLADREPID